MKSNSVYVVSLIQGLIKFLNNVSIMKMFSLLFCNTFFVLTQGNPPLQIELLRVFLSHLQTIDGVDYGIEKTTFAKTRLPATNVIPTNYIIFWTPIIDNLAEFEQFSIPGTVTITVTAVTNTHFITLNSLHLDIVENTIEVKPLDKSDSTVYKVTGKSEPSNEFYLLELNEALSEGKEYSIFIEFTSYIATTKLNGIYLTGYLDPETNEFSNVLTTQFQASAARQAFPCFDEPWVKATFKIYVGYDRQRYIALSNGQEVRETPHPTMPSGWSLKEFNETVKMSTYLIAIVIANYKYVEAPADIFPKPVRIYGPSHLINGQKGGDYAATKAAEFLAYFEKYYEIEYKMDKMDSVAIPAFWFGAMENWGLNIYRENNLMYFNQLSTEAERESTTLVLAHELCHQWFGNLVTAEFWDQIWVNEGLATYFEYIAVAEVVPEFHTLTLRQHKVFQVAMAFDASEASHPLINYAERKHKYDKLMEVFDRITYRKGASLIRMMEGFLTLRTLKNGLKNFLKKKSYEGANQNELFQILTEEGHQDGTLPLNRTVKEVMDTWSLQSGFPLVSVTKSSKSRIHVTQERFVKDVKYSNGSILDPHDLWTIPVAVATADNPDFDDLTPDFWIEKDVRFKSIEGYDTTKWILFNADAAGYYRVLYDDTLLNLLLDQLNNDPTVISVVSRSQLIDDYFTFWVHKFIQVEDTLQLTKYLGHETEAVVWTTVFSHLRPILNKVSDTLTFNAFRSYLAPKLIQALTLIGFEQLPHHNGTNVILRSELLDWACSLQHARCLTYASKLFSEWHASPGMNPLLRDLLFESSDIITPLKILFLQVLGTNRISRTETTNYIARSASKLIKALGAVAISNYIHTISTYVGTTGELKTLEQMVQDNAEDLETFRPTLNANFIIIRKNIQWRKENEERLRIWFSEN